MDTEARQSRSAGVAEGDDPSSRAGPPFAPAGTIVLARADIETLMDQAAYIEAVETAFRASAEGGTQSPLPLHIPVDGGAFHGKGARLGLSGGFVALKFNGNFPGNPARNGLPTIQGAVLLCDARNGRLLAILDSIEVTLKRTAAATALAARFLARRDARIATFCGCGEQAREHLRFLARERPLVRVYAWDLDPQAANRFVIEMTAELAIDVHHATDLSAATTASGIVVTCTSARSPFLGIGDVRPGTFVAAVGADSPQKNEIVPALLARSKLVVDVLEQCAEFGDLHHAIDARAMTADDVHASLAELVTGGKPGRTDDREITIFDSTGTAIQDVAAAVAIYERALAAGRGLCVALGERAVIPHPRPTHDTERRAP